MSTTTVCECVNCKKEIKTPALYRSIGSNGMGGPYMEGYFCDETCWFSALMRYDTKVSF